MTDPAVLAAFIVTYLAVAGYVGSLVWRDRKQRERR